MFSGSVLLANYTDKQDAAFNSDPPYEIGWAKQGNILVRANNWGNVDNTLDCDVQWGVPKKGFLQTEGNALSDNDLTWATDPALSMTQLTGAAGVSAKVAGFIAIPHVKSRFMRLVFALGGTTQEVDVQSWFYGHN